ncbi:MAG TPA: metallophosphoesterase [Thermoanaerobaculia bacterium]|nr:metallophosphoesterase [Thermoanaerobaculia bacterium]
MASLGAAGAMLHGSAARGAARRPRARRGPPRARGGKPDFTAAFLSDPHVFDQKEAARGFVDAVGHAMSPRRPPELLITGGDLAFDILETDRARADAQYDLFDRGLATVKVPVHHTIGNHDCLGVYESSGMSPTDPLYGKAYYQQRFGLEKPYHSFDHERWHFVILDTIGIVERGYRGFVDEEQLAWLADDLAAANRPTVVIGHIPLFSNYIEWRRGTEQGIPPGVAVVNSHQVAEILLRHPVKLALAGHLHIVETFRYKGIEFSNIGAVSGNWWDGLRDGFEEGYALLEFRGDEVSWSYVDYGWEVATSPATAA